MLVSRKSSGVIIVLSTTLVLSGCISFPPPYDPNPHVVVEYTNTGLFQGASDALFLKSVTQYVTRAYEAYTPIAPLFGGDYHWEFPAQVVWKKLFICSTNLDTGETRLMREWPQGLGQPSRYMLSRPLGRAALLYANVKVAVIDLHTFKWHYIKFPNSSYSVPSNFDLSPTEQEFVAAIWLAIWPPSNTQHVQGIAVCNFEGQYRFLQTAERPMHVGWMQKSNLIRVTMESKYVIVDPSNLSIVEEGKLNRSNMYGELPPEESRHPLDPEYPSRTVNLNAPHEYKGSFSLSKAATMW